MSSSYRAHTLIARLSVRGDGDAGGLLGVGEGRARISAAGLPAPPGLVFWSHHGSGSAEQGARTHLATSVHSQNDVVVSLCSCHFLNLVCRLVMQTSAGTTGGTVRMGTGGKLRK